MVTLACYLVSLQVAAERKRLDQISATVVSAERDVRALETEFDTRASLAQLERWNSDTLALVAPTAGQFVRNGAQLASISFDGALPQAGMQTAALVVPAAAPMVTTAAATAPAIVTANAETPKVKTTRPAVAPVVVAAIAKPTPGARRKASALPTILVSIAKPVAVRRTQTAMLDRALLSDSTLGDLMSGARGETGRLR